MLQQLFLITLLNFDVAKLLIDFPRCKQMRWVWKLVFFRTVYDRLCAGIWSDGWVIK